MVECGDTLLGSNIVRKKYKAKNINTNVKQKHQKRKEMV